MRYVIGKWNPLSYYDIFFQLIKSYYDDSELFSDIHL
jgi:hypothetical protein